VQPYGREAEFFLLHINIVLLCCGIII